MQFYPLFIKCLQANTTRLNLSTRVGVVSSLLRYQHSEAIQDKKESPAVNPDVAKELKKLQNNFLKFIKIAEKKSYTQDNDLAHAFNAVTLATQKIGTLSHESRKCISNMSTTLLNELDRSMFDTPKERREQLAGSIWQFCKANNLIRSIENYNVLLKCLNDNDTTFDPQKILNEIKEMGYKPNETTYKQLIHQYCLQGDVNAATGILETMKEEGYQLRESIFSSLIIGYAQQDDPPSIKDIFQLMISNGITPDSDSHSAAVIHLCSTIGKRPEALQELDNIAKQLEQDHMFFFTHYTDRLFNIVVANKNSHKPVLRIYNIIVNAIDNSSNIGIRYELLNSLARHKMYNECSDIFWRDTKRVHLYLKFLSRIGPNNSHFIVSECNRIRDSQLLEEDPLSVVYYNAATFGDTALLSKLLDKLIQSTGFKTVYLWPLLAQLREEEEVISLLKKYFKPGTKNQDVDETLKRWVWPRFVPPGSSKEDFVGKRE